MPEELPEVGTHCGHRRRSRNKANRSRWLDGASRRFMKKQFSHICDIPRPPPDMAVFIEKPHLGEGPDTTQVAENRIAYADGVGR